MRRPLDAYYTPQDMVYPMLKQALPRGFICEPCVGDGAIARAMARLIPISERMITTNDINQEVRAEFHGDATDPAAEFYGRQQDWFISNPPFGLATPILKTCWDHARVGMAMLLRITYAEPCLNRGQWLQEMANHQTMFMPMHPRHNFREGEINERTGKPFTGGFTTVAWFAWRKDHDWRDYGIDSPFQYVTDWRG